MMRFEISDNELQWRFDPSGGPGGQHANKSATRVELVFNVAESRAFTEGERERILSRLDSELRVVEGATRSQATNRKRALRRLHAMLEEAVRPNPPRRKQTRPSRSARRKRLDAKRARGKSKRLRRPPTTDE